MVENESRTDAVFRALADPSRRAMLERLAEGELTVGQLAEPLDMTLAGASKHIGILENAELVQRRRHGRERMCSLRPDALFAVRDWVERYSVFWADRLDRLDQALKEDDNG